MRPGTNRDKTVADSHHGRVLTTEVGLQIPDDLTYEDWQRAGCQLSGIVNSSMWWLGDWLVYGKNHYGDRYKRGIHEAGLQYQTLRNYAWVAQRFEMERRRGALSFQHHAEVASLPVEDQDQWLDRAEKLNWTTKQLREAIRLAREDQMQDVSRAETVRRLAVPSDRIQWWHRAAAQSGTDLQQWVLTTLDQAATMALEE
ncbi:antibiotic biosynthesis protein [Halostreptopolyspora alba]|uniref:Antibiotic biosynthesis protein n=1 Tax=Halostreptopolyspora alba TaxID=2487137 RepID=A0A3N0EEX3_9ACTN|nr:antibiotic biosynthesis protein [Nocardiopsaceae bacterium YIM 96095]